MKTNYRNQILWVLFFSLFGIFAHAQEISISGTLSDDQGPLPGVNIVEKGTTNGVTTDFDGNYTISNVASDGILVFSYVGYLTQELAVDGKETINVNLKADSQKLDEVVVVGYGTVRKSDLTGSVSSVDGEKLKEFPVTSIDQGIQGRAAGVQVSQTSAAPGGGLSIRVRGANSISSGSEPLYVIDGFPIYPDNSSAGAGGNRRPTNVLATLNPNDIESIEVLKDASGTAIYGSRGSNGVVLITTKAGTSGKLKISYDGSYSLQQPAKRLDVLNATDYALYQNLRAASRGITEPYPDPQSLGRGTYWQDEIFRTGGISNHQLSFTGGSENTKYAFTVGTFKNEGIVLNSDFGRNSIRANIDSKGFDGKLVLGTRNTFSRGITNAQSTDRGGPGGLTITAIGSDPTEAPFTPDGNYNFFLYDGRFDINPIAESAEARDTDKTNRMLSNTFVQYELLKGLKAKTSFGFDILNTNRSTYYSLDTRLGRQNNIQKIEASRSLTNILSENTLSYSSELSDAIRMDALAGYTYQTETNKYTEASSMNFTIDDEDANQLEDGLEPLRPQSDRIEWKLESILGRLNFSILDKYLITGTFRRDGSSRFGANNKWANFGSAAVAWKLKQESFMENLDAISDMKLRLSYGLTGNSEIPPYRSLASLDLANYILAGQLVPGLRINRIANDDLKWEKTGQFDVGLDISFLNNRLSFVADYYKIKTDDLLLEVALPSSIGFTNALKNSGALENTGYEFAVNGVIASSDNFKWDINANISFVRNEITDLGDSAPFNSASPSGHLGIRGSWVDIGEPIGVWKGLTAIGIWQSEEEIAANASFGFDKPGYVRYADLDGDGEITGDDESIIGDPNPDFTWGLSQNLSYKNFDLDIFIQGSQGNQVRNLQAAEHADGVGNYNQYSVAFEDAWTPSNTDASRPIIDANREFADFFRNSSFFIEDGSYIRLQNVSLGYNLPEIRGLEAARVYVSAQNLFVITDYSGYDPEVNNSGQDNLNRADDYDAYPRAKTFTLGVNLKF
ncbi:TonB-dependent receptor [Pseudozobellia sp. WGM2]|uniref:SusC/RagA family TonB-linked outer membrane protein n=1 Tax=Pseudozobellia sp. WGM2 TaxID=2787625 RepID=UPI001AE0334D|nr:TonB-dependent receptor [Pseudozobellia sp. WGM2]